MAIVGHSTYRHVGLGANENCWVRRALQIDCRNRHDAPYAGGGEPASREDMYGRNVYIGGNGGVSPKRVLRLAPKAFGAGGLPGSFAHNGFPWVNGPLAWVEKYARASPR